MQATYTLDTRIEALNLLDQLDGDFHRVNDRLKIPLKTLRGWRSSEKELRRRFEDREYRHFANIKLELLKDLFETSRDFMKKLKSGEHEGITVSQLVYALSTLLNQAHQLEESLEDLPPNAQMESEQSARLVYVAHDNLPSAPPRAAGSPEKPGALQSIGVREKLETFLIGADRDPEAGPPGTDAPPTGRPLLPDGERDPARSGKGRQTPKRRRHKPKQKARRSAKKRHDRHR